MLRSCYRTGLAACFLVLSIAAAADASRPSESLLPNTTKGFLSIGNIDQLRDSWNKTQLGQLMQDPVMKPFAEDLKQQFQNKWSKSHQQLGLAWEDLEGLPSGEVAVGVIQPAKGEAALAILVDVSGHEAQTEALIEKISKKLISQQAKRSTRQVRGTTVTQFDTAKTEDRPATHAAFFMKDGLLVASDNAKVLEGVLARMTGESTDSLAGLTSFGAVMKRCQTSAGEQAPHIRWFLEPFGYVEAVRVASPPRERRKGLDLLKILKNQGFTAVQGLGGYLSFATDRYEMLHRTAIYAPAVKAGAEKYELAARMLDFPAGGKLAPQSWIPREIATYASFHWNIQGAFEASSTLVDEIVGEKVFEDILTSMQQDPNGPQINVRTDLIGKLGTRATVISDYKLPITPKSERMLIAIEATDVQGLADTIEKAMKSDENAKRREFQGHVIWEIIAEDQAAGDVLVSLESNSAFGSGEKTDEGEEPEIKMPNSAVTVAFGHLLVCTHIDFLEKVLSQNETLGQSTDYQIVHAELEKLTGSDNSVQAFSRTDEEYRAVYELIRTDKMPEAETMLGRVLNAVLGDGKKGVLRTQKIDGRSLPEYDAVRRYFGPAGLSVISEKDGWFVMGFTLSKEQGLSPETTITTAAAPSATIPDSTAPSEVAE